MQQKNTRTFKYLLVGAVTFTTIAAVALGLLLVEVSVDKHKHTYEAHLRANILALERAAEAPVLASLRYGVANEIAAAKTLKPLITNDSKGLAIVRNRKDMLLTLGDASRAKIDSFFNCNHETAGWIQLPDGDLAYSFDLPWAGGIYAFIGFLDRDQRFVVQNGKPVFIARKELIYTYLPIFAALLALAMGATVFLVRHIVIRKVIRDQDRLLHDEVSDVSSDEILAQSMLHMKLSDHEDRSLKQLLCDVTKLRKSRSFHSNPELEVLPLKESLQRFERAFRFKRPLPDYADLTGIENLRSDLFILSCETYLWKILNNALVNALKHGMNPLSIRFLESPQHIIIAIKNGTDSSAFATKAKLFFTRRMGVEIMRSTAKRLGFDLTVEVEERSFCVLLQIKKVGKGIQCA